MIQINKSEVNKIDLDSILDENDIDRMLERGPITALYPKVDKKQKVVLIINNQHSSFF